MAVKTADEYREDMSLRIRWAADAATNAYIHASVPDAYESINVIASYIRDAESSLQVAKQYLALYDDAICAEDNDLAEAEGVS
jgi:hypothetical protein